MWYLYVLYCSDGSLYTGITTDLKRRVTEHNTCKSRASKYVWSRRPAILEVFWEYPDRSSASKAEHAFKKLKKKEKWARVMDPLPINYDKAI